MRPVGVGCVALLPVFAARFVYNVRNGLKRQRRCGRKGDERRMVD